MWSAGQWSIRLHYVSTQMNEHSGTFEEGIGVLTAARSTTKLDDWHGPPTMFGGISGYP